MPSVRNCNSQNERELIQFKPFDWSCLLHISTLVLICDAFSDFVQRFPSVTTASWLSSAKITRWGWWWSDPRFLWLQVSGRCCSCLSIFFPTCLDRSLGPFTCPGIVDDLTAAGVPCFGPSAKAAQLEASKSFSKAFMERHGIPTARYGSFSDAQEACRYIRTSVQPTQE